MAAGGGGNRDGDGDAAPMHVVMLPWLAFGHIVPFAQLARRLLASSSSSVRVTFLTAAGNVPRVEAMLSSAASPAGGGAAVVPLRLPRVPGLPEGAASTADLSPDGAELLKVALDAARPQVAALLAELRPDAVLLDFATPWAFEDAAALGVKSLHFSVFSAVARAYLVVPARCPYDGARPSARDLMSAPTGFPGSSPLAATGVPAYQAADFAYVFTSFGGQPSVYDRVMASIQPCDGVVLKTCAEMEDAYVDYLAAQFKKPVLMAGPLVPPEPLRGEEELDERWATWLSAFPHNAVVLASFGSETFLPPAAATELLLGLEATGRPFLAVLNSPDGGEAVVPPPGFAERVSGRGLVHSGWVQQQHILRHRSVGCYVTHAGFSSVVEGLVAGCRLVLLPMKGDQYLNAALFARELRVGVEVPRRDEDGWFGRQDVCDAVAAAVAADGGGGDATSKWAEFLTDDAVQGRFADDFVRQLRELVSAASS